MTCWNRRRWSATCARACWTCWRFRHSPIDVLMQQIVAACGAESWEKDALFEVMRRAYPYRELTRRAV